MKSSLFKSKTQAALIHLLVTAAVAGVVIGFVTHFWFPYGTLKFLKGWELFLLLLACDVVLGPALSAVVFNPAKPRRELWTDYAVIVLIQLAALIYGVNAVSQNRLQFLVFAVDRYEAVSAGELSRQDLAAAADPRWRDPGYLEHFIVGVQPPSPESKNYLDAVIRGLDGQDLQLIPSNYQEINRFTARIRSRIKPLEQLPVSAQATLLKSIPNALPKDSIGWLPLSHDRTFWTLIVKKDSGMPIRAVAVDPYASIEGTSDSGENN